MGKNKFRVSFAAMGILVLIIDAKTALEGAASGISLCLQSVVPSIFPFLVLTGVLNSMMLGATCSWIRPLGKLLKIPDGTQMIFLTGLLGGYPAGAQAVFQAWKNKQLDRSQAARMLAFCNNAGPAFLFGILGAKFISSSVAWALWGIHILSAVAVGCLLPGKLSDRANVKGSPLTWTQAVRQSVRTMGIICGWIVLFRILLSFLDRWFLWAIPIPLRVTIYGLLELANGCCNLHLISLPGLRFVIASVLLSFGGLCITTQTASVVEDLGMKQYFLGKLLQTAISLLLSILLQFMLFSSSERIDIPWLLLWIPLVFVAGITIYMGKNKNNSSIPATLGV